MQAAEAARKLDELLRSRRVVQMLQQPLPDVATQPHGVSRQLSGHQQQAAGQKVGLLIRICDHLQDFGEAMCTSDTNFEKAVAERNLSSALQHQAAHNTAVLLVWVLQLPVEVLQQQFSVMCSLQARASFKASAAPTTLAAIWAMSTSCLNVMAQAVDDLRDSSSAAPLLATITQQLGQAAWYKKQNFHVVGARTPSLES
jgi:hypothetical protein